MTNIAIMPVNNVKIIVRQYNFLEYFDDFLLN